MSSAGTAAAPTGRLNINGRHTCSITGNRIGTNAAGTAAIPNALDGIYINDPSDVTIGGSAPGEGNLISGNGRHGIWHSVEGGGYATNDTHILGNRIGTDITGNGAIGNGGAAAWPGQHRLRRAERRYDRWHRPGRGQHHRQ
ncbi:MAG: hypothetical protein U0232_20825 [Thermomicrobiales bacterium]